MQGRCVCVCVCVRVSVSVCVWEGVFYQQINSTTFQNAPVKTGSLCVRLSLSLTFALFCLLSLFCSLFLSFALSIYTYIYTQQNLSKSTNHGTDFKRSIQGGGRLWELEYLYGQLFGTEIKRSIQEGISGGSRLERFSCTSFRLSLGLSLPFCLSLSYSPILI